MCVSQKSYGRLSEPSRHHSSECRQTREQITHLKDILPRDSALNRLVQIRHALLDIAVKDILEIDLARALQIRERNR
jgi:hypothetical protein